jgi:hypothetical protein
MPSEWKLSTHRKRLLVALAACALWFAINHACWEYRAQSANYSFHNQAASQAHIGDSLMEYVIFFAVGIFIGRVTKKVPKQILPTFVECPHCQDPVRIGATVCKSCHRSVEKELASR